MGPSSHKTGAASGLIQLKQRVEVLEFGTGVFSCEVPIGLGVVCISVVLPGVDRPPQLFFVAQKIRPSALASGWARPLMVRY